MSHVVFVVGMLTLAACGDTIGEPCENSKSSASPGSSSYGEVLRAIREHNLPKEQYAQVLPFLLSVYLERHDNRCLTAIRTLHESDHEAMTRIASRIAETIRESTNEIVLSDLYDMLIGAESIPPLVASAVRWRVAHRRETGASLPDTKAIAVLLTVEPDGRGHRESLENELRHESKVLRMVAADALGRTGAAAKKSVPLLIALAGQDKSVAVRVVAARAVWRIDRNPKPVVPVLVDALGHDDESVLLRPQGVSSSGLPTHRHIAAHLLGEMKTSDRSVIRGLISVLDAKHDALLRSTAITALGSIGDCGNEAVSVLKQLRQDQDEIVRTAATEALRKVDAHR